MRKRHEVRDPAALLACVERREAANAVRSDRTRQRRFEQGFLSLDAPGADGVRRDWGDGGRAAAGMLRAIDAPARAARRYAALNRAAARLPRSQRLLRPLLWAIYRNGSNRRETMGELGISKRTYWRGVKFFLKLFSAQ